MGTLDSILVQLRDEDRAQFGTGEVIHRGVIYPSMAALVASGAMEVTA